MKKEGYLMASTDEGSTEHVDVILDTPNLWVKEIGDHAGTLIRNIPDGVDG